MNIHADEKSAPEEMICIACPMGCRLRVWREAGELKVTGNTCKRGEVYGKQEYTSPMRTVTTTVALEDRVGQRLPVKTRKAVSKALVGNVLEAAKTVTVSAPVRVGQVLVENIGNTGEALVATRTVR